MKLFSRQHLTNEELKQLASLQLQLDTIYENKARGASIRSRQIWMDFFFIWRNRIVNYHLYINS